MHRIFRVKAYEAEHGPHFNEEHARKAVSKMENEDGTRGPHWSVEETTALASQYGINLGSRFNREVSELKNIIRKANQMVPPPMKEMLPQDMKNAMDKVGQ